MKRPSITPSFLSELTGSVPSRLLKKLDKKPELADGWRWTSSDDEARIETESEAVVTIRAAVVAVEADLACTCLLAPRCLHRLAVATRLPLAGAEDQPATDADAADGAALDDPASDDRALLAPSAVTDGERRAARCARAALASMLSAGVRGAGATVQAELLRAIHDAREAKLSRLAALLLVTLSRTRAIRDGEPVRVEEVLAAAAEGLALAWRFEDEDAVTLVDRGLARRTYREMPPTALWGLAAMPIWTKTGYSGVVTWLVDKAGTVFTAHTLTPADGRGGSAQLALLQTASLTHAEASRGQVMLQHGTRSFDRRLGAGKRVLAVVAGKSSLFEDPAAKLFEVPVRAQLERFWAEHDRPVVLRRAGWDLLAADATIAGSAGDDELAIVVEGQTLRALRPTSGGAARDSWRLLTEAAGARVRIVARLVAERERAVTLVSVAHRGHDPERWDVGFDETQLATRSQRHGALRDLLDAARTASSSAGDARPRSALPEELSRHPWTTLERIVAQAGQGGWRTLPASREPELRADQATLRGLGLNHGADLLEALRRAALPRGRHHSGRLLAPDPESFAAAITASKLYLRALAEARHREVWR